MPVAKRSAVIQATHWPLSKPIIFRHNSSKKVPDTNAHAEPNFDKVTKLWKFLEDHVKKAIPGPFEEEDLKQDNDKC